MIELRSAGQHVIVDALLGGRISRWSAQGQELLLAPRPQAPPVFGGCYPMVPWAGRIGDARFSFRGNEVTLEPDAPPHALHGLAYRRAWQVVEASSAQTTLTFDLGSPAARAAGWPFGGRAEQTISLTGEGVALQMAVSADHAMPVTIGWHPWFRKEIGGVTGHVDIDAATMWERGADHLPTGKLILPPPGPWDDAFPQPDGVSVSVVWQGVGRVDVTSDANHLVVFDDHPEGLCVEPQTGPPNAANMVPVVLEAGEVVRASMQMAYEAS